MTTPFFFLFLPFLAQASWIDDSNRIAKSYAQADGANFPERASAMGLREFDGKALHMGRDANEREAAFLREWLAKIHTELNSATDPNLQIDLKILRDHFSRRLEEIRLEEKHGVISFFPGTRFVLESLLSLVNEQSPLERKLSALDRFKLYVNGEGEEPPLLTAFRNRTLADQLRFGKKSLAPLRAELEQYLAESPSYLKGVKETLARAGAPGWEEDFETFSRQSAEFDSFLRTQLLPLSRKDFKLPKDIYAHTLRMRGIESSPEELIRSAHASYKKLYKEFRERARDVARVNGLRKNDPVSVIQFLKKKQVLAPELVKPLFEDANAKLTTIIEREKLVTLPKEPLRIRVAGEAESMANPVPHLNEPPLLGNRGERPEFVVPSFASGKAALDDFTYSAAALVLTAHEGRPGHDLQFSSMLDNGTSMVRARYAFNNANVEGWGLYAEELVYPFLPAEAQLVALQMRLIRVARAFLDPEVQLGKIQPREVRHFLTSELGISPRLASLELRRFQFESPGQAPSYFYGLERMEGARRKLSASLGKNFTSQCFHDGVLSLGMLPVGMIGSELSKNLSCGSKAQARK